MPRLGREWWLVLLVAALALAGCVALGVTTRLDNAFYDAALRHRATRLDSRVLIVTVDDRSLAALGAWPWPRSRTALLLDRLHAGGVRAIAVDELLVEQSAPAEDAALASALARDAPVFLPVAFAVPGRNGASYDLALPAAGFAEAAAGLGHVNLAPDGDGVVRSAYLAYDEAGASGTRSWPHLASLLAGAKPPPVGTASPGNRRLLARQPLLIPFAGPRGSIPAVSAMEVLAGHVPAALTAGRLVLVGVTASGLGDSYATPAGIDGALLPGIEVQANLLNALLTGGGIAAIGGWALILASLVPVLALHLALLRLPPRWTLLAIGVALGGTAAASAMLLWHGVWLAPGAALLGVAALYPLWAWRRLATISAFMGAELEALDREADPLERPRPPLAALDPVSRQIGLLRSAIDRGRDLRAFLIARIAQMPDAVLVTDLAGKVVLANSHARALFAELTGGLPGAVPLHADALLGCLRRDDTGAPEGLRFSTATGAAIDQQGRTYDIADEPQHASGGELVGHIIRIADTTAATLLRRQREDAVQLLSHDMRAPQAAILALLDSPDGTAVPAPLVNRLRNLARRTLSLADDFVHLSRAEMATLVPEPLDLAGLAQDAVEALWPVARSKQIALSLEAGDAALVVEGDASLLARAIGNLVDNALKFTPDGGRVTVTAGSEGGEARVAVRDTGQGVAEEHQARIFERFARAPTGAMKDVGGSGLGLAFVHTVAVRHGGRVTCESTPGAGACFTLWLPLAEAT